MPVAPRHPGYRKFLMPPRAIGCVRRRCAVSAILKSTSTGRCRREFRREGISRRGKVYEDLLRTYPPTRQRPRTLPNVARLRSDRATSGARSRPWDRLVAQYPQSVYRDEAEFRRGELLFTLGRYPEAGRPTERVDAERRVVGVSRARALHARLVFVQAARLEEGLHSFSPCSIANIIGRDDGAALESSRAHARERELTEDTFR